jgi:tRNA nucleotidyltransferase (CCA-adding enzyme)
MRLIRMATHAFLDDLDILPSATEMKTLADATEWMSAALNIALVPLRRAAEVVVGGSYAKGTLVKSEMYDIDLFVRFKGEISELLQTLLPGLREICESHSLPLERVHGSREYFRILYKPHIVFEIIPVAAISSPREATNITDLSHTHVAYIRRELKKRKNLLREICLAKQFCKAQDVYGAESYVQGFSGYALECLIIAYGSFLKMLKALANAKKQIVLDPKHHYATARETLFSLNESKLRSPLVLVDPTWKERNVLAALSAETFARFQKAAHLFLRKPRADFFLVKEVSDEERFARAKKLKAELVSVFLETQKQPGDIAGTKLKRFADALARHFGPHFSVIERAFTYSGKHTGHAYYFVRPAKQVFLRGPPLSMNEHARAFKHAHAHTIIKRGVLYAPAPRPVSAAAYIKKLLQGYEKMVREMDICSARVVDVG